ncbi:UPF0700 transmembrane protein YoaK [Ktedonobacter sp. SOSP1-52]|uniref:YoaK family protein n=1 Tax=Ktedonobacter sp. SOSP1-52 TaxID=2778366 RepID=UPI0019154B72|nr:YoaK family protein [Ktedonobacter sp. SOSP1-52]GHO63790.1 UPF0700 transmembrane protein YoaK [Ktedonobacter sp. SOSP1-52]
MVLLLTCVSSSMDAISFLRLGHVFIANMTGNVVLFGLALGQAHFEAILYTSSALVGFCIGVASGAAIPWQETPSLLWPLSVTKILVFETLVFGVFCLLWYTLPAHALLTLLILLVLSAMAMGLQSVAVTRLTIHGVVTTYITDTMNSLIRTLVRSLKQSPHGSLPATSNDEIAAFIPFTTPSLQATMLLIYLFGALISGLITLNWPSLVLFLPCIAIAIVFVRTVSHSLHERHIRSLR